MFKNIDTYLLKNHPLLWNIRIVPAVGAAIGFHILFFLIGIYSGDVDFNDLTMYDSMTATSITIFFSILVSLLFFVVWIMYYFRNNAFRSFYPLSAKKLYLEWLLIFVISIANVSYSMSFLAGKTVRTRNFLSKEETIKRSEIISMMSLFLDGAYNYQSGEMSDSEFRERVEYNKKKYPENSLFNKTVDNFNYRDSNPEKTVKNWMQNNDSTKIKELIKSYFKIIDEHKLDTNLNADLFFKLTYDYPNFTKYEIIGKGTNESNTVNYGQQTNFKHYVPQNKLVRAYTQMYKSWTEPIIDIALIYTLFYIALGIAMLLFSLRATNRKSWLIALVISGCLWILTGIFTAIISSSVSFLLFWLITIIAIASYFVMVLIQKREKRASEVILNLLLWTIAGFFPILYALLMLYYDVPTQQMNGTDIIYTNTKQHTFLNDHAADFALVNIALVTILMFMVATAIRKWKGLPED